MTGNFEAMADVATGALAARAVEGPGGEHGNGEHAAICANCGTALVGPHCHQCGQMGHVHRTVGAIFHDIAHGVFHFEGRTWHTLPLLFWKPGELTRRYAYGERAKFVSPMGLFLFSVFLMVATFSGIHQGSKSAHSNIVERAGAATELSKANTALANLKVAHDALKAKAVPTAVIDDQMRELDTRIARLRLVTTGQITPGENDNLKIDSKDFHTGIGWIDDLLGHFTNNPELMIYKLQSASYKYSWALIPISLPFIWLMFAFRRDVGMYDHAVFATYSLAAMSLMVVALWIAGAIGVWPALLWTIVAFFPPWHMYRQLKGAYLLGRFGAIWRTCFLVIAAYTSAIIFFTTILVLELKG